MKRKLLSCLLAGVMTISCLTACGEQSSSKVNTSETNKEASSEASEVAKESESTPVVVEDELSYPLDTDETLTIAMMSYHFKPAGGALDITDTPYWKAWQEKTGVKLEMDVYETEDAFQLMLAGGEMPDIIMYSGSLYNGGEAKMIEDEIISPLTMDEINKWAPDLAEVLNTYETERKLLTVDGNIVGFPSITGSEKMMATNGLIIRGDWLEDLGMDVPTTPDQFLDMLRAFKTEKGAEYPMALTAHRLNLVLGYGIFSSPFDLVSPSGYQVDGEYHIGWIEPGYKELLEFFHTMYEEGLINPDFLTLDQATVDGMLYDGRTGVVQQSVIGGMGAYIPALAESDPDAKLMGIGSLLGPNGEKAYYGATEASVHSFKGYITTSCENKELAMKFLNYNYTEEGQMFQQFGIEGESYELVNGYPTYTEVVTNNPDGRTMAQGLQQYCRAGAFWPYVSRLEYFEQSAGLPEQQQAATAWDENDRNEYMVPAISALAEDKEEFSKISAETSTYHSEMRAKFISGEVSFDEWDSFVQGLKDRGIDRQIEIMQKALDEFNAR